MIEMEIRAADRRAGDAQDGVAGMLDARHGLLFHRDARGTEIRQRFHGDLYQGALHRAYQWARRRVDGYSRMSLASPQPPFGRDGEGSDQWQPTSKLAGTLDLRLRP